MDIALLNTNSKSIQQLFDYILKSGIYKDFNFSEIDSEVEKYFHSSKYSTIKSRIERNDLIEEFENFSFSDLNNYKYDNNDINTVYKLIIVLSLFKSELIKLLSTIREKRLKKNYGALKRKVSPPLEAYDYVGNNKLDIEPTDLEYGLLFE